MNKLEIMLRRIPGVEYENAIKRMSDNTAFYAELLRLFFNDDPPKSLVAAFEKKEYAKAEFEAHSMKGTAANLGLTDISRLAAEIHLNLKDRNLMKTKAMLAELEKACGMVSEIVKQTKGGTEDAK